MKTNFFRKNAPVIPTGAKRSGGISRLTHNATIKATAHVSRFLGKLGMTVVLLSPVGLAAQNGVDVSNLVVGAGTVTFNVSWDKTSDDLKNIVWSDTVWVFVDYNAGGVMKRLPLATGATLTATSAPGVGRVIQYPDNNKGVWVVGNAKSEDNASGSFSATVQLLTATADLSGMCVYASNYPPVAEYATASSITFTGTPPFDLVLSTGGQISVQTGYELVGSQTLVSFTDKTGAPGIMKCIPPATFTLTASASGFCEDDATGVTFALDDTENGRKYRLYRDGIAMGGEITGGGNGISFGAFAAAGTYTALTVAEGQYCAVPMGGELVIAKNLLPASPQLNVPADVCQNDGDIVFVASDYSGAVDWSLSSGGTADGNSYTFTSSVPGTKSVTVQSVQTYTDASTCYSPNKPSRTAEVYALPAVPILTVKDATNTASATFTASEGSGTYAWNGCFYGLTGAVQYTLAEVGEYSAAVQSIAEPCRSEFSETKIAKVTALAELLQPCSSDTDCLSGICRCKKCVSESTACYNDYFVINPYGSCPAGYTPVSSCANTPPQLHAYRWHQKTIAYENTSCTWVSRCDWTFYFCENGTTITDHRTCHGACNPGTDQYSLCYRSIY